MLVGGFWDDVATDRRRFLWMLGAALVWHILLHVLVGVWESVTVAALAWAPLLAVPVWAIWSTYTLLAQEVAGNEPPGGWVQAWGVVLSKLVATLVQIAVFTAVIGPSALWIFYRSVGPADLADQLPVPALDWFFWTMAKLYLGALLAVLLLAVIVQLAYLVSRLVESYNTLLMVWVFLLLSWVGIRIIPVVGDWMAGLPDFAFREFFSVGPALGLRLQYYDSGPFAAAIVYTLIVSVAAGLMLFYVVPYGTTAHVALGEEDSNGDSHETALDPYGG